MNLFSRSRVSNYYYSVWMIRNLWPIWIMFFCNIIKSNHFLYRFIIWLHLISSFSLTKSLLVPYAYISIESLDCVLLSSFECMEIWLIWLISSVKTLCLSFLNLCRGFYINLMFFYWFFMIYFKTISVHFSFF